MQKSRYYRLNVAVNRQVGKILLAARVTRGNANTHTHAHIYINIYNDAQSTQRKEKKSSDNIICFIWTIVQMLGVVPFSAQICVQFNTCYFRPPFDHVSLKEGEEDIGEIHYYGSPFHGDEIKSKLAKCRSVHRIQTCKWYYQRAFFFSVMFGKVVIVQIGCSDDMAIDS